MNSINKNMKHPVDELFQQKLNNYEIQASNEAKEKFLMAINKQKSSRRPLLFFSAAASILLVGIISLFLYTDLFFHSAPELANMEQTKTQLDTKQPTEDYVLESPKAENNERQSPPSLDNAVSVTATRNSPVTLKTSKPTNLKEVNSSVKNEENRSLTGVSEIDEPILDKLTIALLDSEKKKNLEQKTSQNLQPRNKLFKKSIGETIIIVTSELREEEIYIPDVNSDSPITVAEAKDLGESKLDDERSFVAKVFTELKHLKHGEKVSINAILASNDDSFINNEDGFIGYEAMQFKQRFKRIKNTITKE